LKTDAFSIAVSPTITKALHGGLQLGALCCLIVGLVAVYQATLKPEPQPALTSIHSWVGVVAISVYLLNFLLAISREIFKRTLPIESIKTNTFLNTSIHMHRFLGLLALLSTSSAIVTGVMDFNGSSCDYEVTQADNNPAMHYQLIPSGCRVSNGNNNNNDILVTFE